MKLIFSDSLGYEDYDDIKNFEILIVSYLDIIVFN